MTNAALAIRPCSTIARPLQHTTKSNIVIHSSWAEVSAAPYQTAVKATTFADGEAPATVTAAEAAATATDLSAPSHAHPAKKRKKNRSTLVESGATL